MAEDVMLLTVREAAQLLRISRNLAYELVTRGEIPAIRLGRVIRVPRTALDQWLEAGSLGVSTDKHPSERTGPLYGRAKGVRSDGRRH